MKPLITLLIIFLTNAISYSQSTYKAEEFQSALMETKTGAMVVYTGQKHSFTIDVNGEVSPTEDPNFINVGNKILQSLIIPFPSKIDFENLSEKAIKENLLGYMDY